MSDKQLYYIITGYILLILAIVSGGITLIVTRTGIIIGCLLLLLPFFIIDVLVKRLNKFNTRIRMFLNMIEDREHMTWFYENSADSELNALNQSFNRINTLLAEAQTDKHKQEKFYFSLLEEVPDGIVAWNKKYRILFANGAALHLLGMEQLCFVNQLEQVYPAFSRFTYSPPKQGSFLLQSIHQKQLSLSFNCMQLEAESITILAIKDISNELNDKENESWLKLTRILTHEIMNTIAPIVSLSQNLLLHPDNDPKRQRKLTIICQQSERLRDFTEAYRRLYSIPAPQAKSFSLNALLQNLEILLQSELEHAHIHFQIHSTPLHIHITGDEKQLSQVFLNLIKNSIQALEGQTDRYILIDLIQTDKLYIQIADNGKGIPNELQEKIFVPFFTTKTNGTGIGLSLCKQIIKLHKGNLYLQKSHPGDTIFVIELPLNTSSCQDNCDDIL